MVKNLISIFLFLFPLIAKCEWSFASGTGGGTLTDNTGWSLSLTLSDTSFSITKCNATGSETDIDLSDEISGFPIGYEITAIQNVFSGKAITSFTPPVSLTTIGANAFKNCSSLTNIVFPDNLAVINTSAFENCTALKQVILPDSPHIIGDYAFRNIGAELVSFGKKSVTIKNSAFINSPAVKRIYFRGDAPNMANGYAFQNSAKNNADSTLANKTRCYFIPFGNSIPIVISFISTAFVFKRFVYSIIFPFDLKPKDWPLIRHRRKYVLSWWLLLMNRHEPPCRH